MCTIEMLIDKYLTGTATEEEIKTVDDWYAAFEINQGIRDQFDSKQLHKSLQNNWNIISKALKL